MSYSHQFHKLPLFVAAALLCGACCPAVLFLRRHLQRFAKTFSTVADNHATSVDKHCWRSLYRHQSSQCDILDYRARTDPAIQALLKLVYIHPIDCLHSLQYTPPN